ncbi:MAG: DNA-3-methyladenine glycosylase I [Tractidigestivibacter sp.]|jgi:DNA-3-methyladenine glycosylase I|uniref:DNA-3-methyladenine glycosylase I n=1 Tax=Tractidigestivibacter sp. TaxID=2847320 RepID=UPI003D92F9F9
MGFCAWKDSSALMREYHDNEWGVPTHDDQKQFEHLMLEALQCGLSWSLILKKREVIRQCFANFDFEKVAAFGDDDVARILATEGMIRSERKVRAVIKNANCFIGMRDEFGTFSSYVWNMAGNATILYEGHAEGKVPVSNGLSARLAHQLKRRGFSYLGPVTVYSHLQACGIICDHDKDCPCYQRIVQGYPTIVLPPDNEKF